MHPLDGDPSPAQLGADRLDEAGPAAQVVGGVGGQFDAVELEQAGVHAEGTTGDAVLVPEVEARVGQCVDQLVLTLPQWVTVVAAVGVQDPHVGLGRLGGQELQDADHRGDPDPSRHQHQRAVGPAAVVQVTEGHRDVEQIADTQVGPDPRRHLARGLVRDGVDRLDRKRQIGGPGCADQAVLP